MNILKLLAPLTDDQLRSLYRTVAALVTTGPDDLKEYNIDNSYAIKGIQGDRDSVKYCYCALTDLREKFVQVTRFDSAPDDGYFDQPNPVVQVDSRAYTEKVKALIAQAQA
jgi:hypothetical protein